ncbi:unnamed protein product, partial [Chrysoparadoxa australica]
GIDGNGVAIEPYVVLEPRGNFTSGLSSGPDAQNKQSVLIIYTGGTIGMKKDTGGALAPVPGYFTEQIFAMSDLSKPEMPMFDCIEYEPLLDSSCFRPTDWAHIARDIEKNYFKYDGFVVCMGTDTMAYAASALSFMTEGLGKTIVFTGSQIPFSEVYNDARRNLIFSLILAAASELPEVCLFFNDRLLRGNRSTKIHSFGLNAFGSPNCPPLATLGVSINYRTDLALQPPRTAFRITQDMDSHIVVLKLIPGFDDEALMVIVRNCTRIKAIVLELYGTGNSPNRRESFLSFIREAKIAGIMVVALTQCIQGGVSLSTYAVGAALKEMGVISGSDMTTEARDRKKGLAYLFGRITGPDALQHIAEAMVTNIRGELSPSQSLVWRSAEP